MTFSLAVVVLAFVAAGALGWWVLEQQAEQRREAEIQRKEMHAAELVQSSRNAETAEAPALIGQLAERMPAAEALSGFAADSPRDLAALLMDADVKQFSQIFPKLARHASQASSLLADEIARTLPDEIPFSDPRRDELAKRQANAAVALLRLNQPEKIWPLLRRLAGPDDPRLRSYLIHRLAPLGADPGLIINRLRTEPDVSIRRALVLSLGEFGENGFPSVARNALLPEIQKIYGNEPDPGLHAAAEWLLRLWKEGVWLEEVKEAWVKDEKRNLERLGQIINLLQLKKTSTSPQWYVNCQLQTMILITGPITFMMGSQNSEQDRHDDELLHPRTIRTSYVLSATPVTVRQFLRFDKDDVVLSKHMRTPEMPATAVDWDTAAKYCNWLSRTEGLVECYELEGDKHRLKKNFIRYSGYRLPTEGELEYATRARALTSRYYGETEELLPKYAWTYNNSQGQVWPVGSLKPNDFGFFDMHGNVSCWSLDDYQPYKKGQVTETGTTLGLSLSLARAPRGGSYLDRPMDVRIAARHKVAPAERLPTMGFRIARTFLVK
jgi:formylglycine-generating enzyme required for sulfatase activity